MTTSATCRADGLLETTVFGESSESVYGVYGRAPVAEEKQELERFGERDVPERGSGLKAAIGSRCSIATATRVRRPGFAHTHACSHPLSTLG